MFAGCTHPPAVELAERLVAVLPAGLTRVFYSDNGSTAVEVALKLALPVLAQSRRAGAATFVALHHAYHGDTVGAMSASEDSVFTRPFAPMLFAVASRARAVLLSLPARPRARHLRDRLPRRSRAAARERTASTIAGVLVEPMLQGAGGMIVWPRGVSGGVRRLCDRHGTLMIADEVLTGFGRTGRMFACEHAAVTPDIICLSKALTGGYLPLGATVDDRARSTTRSSATIARRTFFHGHSFTANPLACAVALASLDLFRENDGARTRPAARRLARARVSARSLRLPCVGDVRVIGGVGIVELVGDKATKTAGGYLDDSRPALAAAFLDRGLLLRPLGNVLYLMPPYVITEGETAWAIEQIREVLTGLQAPGSRL